MKLSRVLTAMILFVAFGIPAVGVAKPAGATSLVSEVARGDDTATATRSAVRTAPVAPTAPAPEPEPVAPVETPTTEAPTTTTDAPVTTTTAPPVTTTTAAPVVAAQAPAPAAEPAPEVAAAPAPAATGDLGARVAEIARQQVGKAYRSGATGPSAFDCSGLVFYVFNEAGAGLPRLTDSGYYGRSAHISRGELQPGDIVHSPGHIGIYVGDGQMVHASTSRGGVKLAPIDAVPPTGFGRLS